MTPDQAEMVRHLLTAMEPQLRRTKDLVDVGFEEVVSALETVLTGLPTCHCGKLAVSIHPPAYLCAEHAAREGTGGYILAHPDALDLAQEVLLKWRKKPSPPVGARPVQWTGRCPECQMLLSVPVSNNGPDAVISVECGREHDLTLQDGRHVILDENGFPHHETHLRETMVPSAPLSKEDMQNAPTRFLRKPSPP